MLFVCLNIPSSHYLGLAVAFKKIIFCQKISTLFADQPLALPGLLKWCTLYNHIYYSNENVLVILPILYIGLASWGTLMFKSAWYKGGRGGGNLKNLNEYLLRGNKTIYAQKHQSFLSFCAPVNKKLSNILDLISRD